MRADFFHYQTGNEVKLLLNLVQEIVLQRILITEKNILNLSEGPTGELDDIAITTEVKYFVKTTKSRKEMTIQTSVMKFVMLWKIYLEEYEFPVTWKM